MDMSPKFPEHEHLKCPRCESSNTKFCYYNNYNLSQPRHFCKNCRRYWTKGGTLRNIPVGGGTRKITKRSSNPNKRTTTAIASPPPPPPPPPLQPPIQSDQQPKPKAEQSSSVVYGFGGAAQQTELGDGSFSSMLLRSSSTPSSSSMAMGAFGDLLMDGLSFNNLVHKSDNDDDVLIRNRNPVADEFRSSFLRLNDDNNNSNQKENGNGNGNGGEINGWPDLSIFTPGSSFH